MSLPLPKAQWLGDIPGHTDAVLQAYGQACREAALEEAAQVCNGEQWHNSAMPDDYIEAFNESCGDCEAAIRRLK